jgi:hypothetical protein
MASLSSYFFSMARYVQNARNGQKYAAEGATNAANSAQEITSKIREAQDSETSIDYSAGIIRNVNPYLPTFDVDIDTMELVETSGYMENPNRPLDFNVSDDGILICNTHERNVAND